MEHLPFSAGRERSHRADRHIINIYTQHARVKGQDDNLRVIPCRSPWINVILELLELKRERY